ncbi:MAG TPA: hypothetical protein VK703_07695 [Candidatus Acidoferrales bacterium]|jgi:uncharacterized protein involved in exopolysaccharide biosynthesis|nr:hypothetical protein [Candidatus Acidoferrales bacterium]
MNSGDKKILQLQEPMPNFTMRDLLAPVFRHRKQVLAAFSAVFVLSLLVAWLWASQYYVSRMQVVVQEARTDPAISAGQSAAITSYKPVTTDQVSSEVALLQGQDMMRQITDTCGLGEKPSVMDIFLPTDPNLRKAVKKEHAASTLAKAVKVEALTTSDVIEVKYGNMGDPSTPPCVLKNLSKLYLDKHVQLQRPLGSSNFFAQEADKYQKALAESEARLVDFGKEEGVAAPDVLRTDLAQQTATTMTSLNAAKDAVSADQSRIAKIKAQMAVTPERSRTAEVSNSSELLLQNLQSTLLAAQNKRTELATKYDASYPLVQEADAEIAKTQAAIADAEKARYVNQTTDRDPTYELLREELARAESDLAGQKATVAALNNNVHSMQDELVSLDGKAVKQAQLLREVKANESTYMLYLNKRDQERTSDALDRLQVANVAIAVPPNVPLTPAHSPMLISILGFILAICAGLAAGYIAEYLDPSFRTPAEVAETLNVPVLAAVPRQAA